MSETLNAMLWWNYDQGQNHSSPLRSYYHLVTSYSLSIFLRQIFCLIQFIISHKENIMNLFLLSDHAVISIAETGYMIWEYIFYMRTPSCLSSNGWLYSVEYGHEMNEHGSVFCLQCKSRNISRWELIISSSKAKAVGFVTSVFSLLSLGHKALVDGK